MGGLGLGLLAIGGDIYDISSSILYSLHRFWLHVPGFRVYYLRDGENNCSEPRFEDVGIARTNEQEGGGYE